MVTDNPKRQPSRRAMLAGIPAAIAAGTFLPTVSLAGDDSALLALIHKMEKARHRFETVGLPKIRAEHEAGTLTSEREQELNREYLDPWSDTELEVMRTPARSAEGIRAKMPYVRQWAGEYSMVDDKRKDPVIVMLDDIERLIGGAA